MAIWSNNLHRIALLTKKWRLSGQPRRSSTIKGECFCCIVWMVRCGYCFIIMLLDTVVLVVDVEQGIE